MLTVSGKCGPNVHESLRAFQDRRNGVAGSPYPLNGQPVLAAFAIGLMAGRSKLLAQPVPDAPLWRRGRTVGTLLGLPLAMVGAWLAVGPGAQLGAPGLRETGGVLLGFVSAPLLSWAYVGWLLRWRQFRPEGLRWFRPAGGERTFRAD